MSEIDELPNGISRQIDAMERDMADMEQEISSLKKENAELSADKIHLIQAEMDCGDRLHYTAHDIGYRDLEKKCKALEADYLVSNRELLILQAEIVRLRKERRWIPVSERLPENRGSYYVYLCDDFGFRYDMDFFENGDWISYSPGDVTHWMPLPLPPEGDA